MMLHLAASLIAALALAASPAPPHPRGMDRAVPVVDRYFTGMEWTRDRGRVVCFAGLEHSFDDASGLVTGCVRLVAR